MELYDYQQEMRRRIGEAFRTHRSVMAQMPTGTGKTYLLASVVSEGLRSGWFSSVWVVAHRRELVSQIATALSRYGIPPAAPQVRAMSVQWLTRHWEEMPDVPGLIVIDEAHHALASTYRAMWARYPDAKFLGLTATPCRMNGKAFTDLFEVLVQSWSIPEFIVQGRLAVYDYVSVRADGPTRRLVGSLRKRGADGDYQIKEMAAVLNKRPSIERLYSAWEQFARGRKGIVYAINRDHARAIADFYLSQGIEAVAIDCRTPAEVRQRNVERLKSGEIRVLVNVDIFSEGFDCPDVEFIQLARPTLSLAKYLQMVGRGLRVAENKRSCVMLDNVGLYHVFGLPSQSWDWQAMFEGRMCAKSLPARPERRDAVMECRLAEAGGNPGADSEMTLIVGHEALADVFESQREAQELEARRRKFLSGCPGRVIRCGRELVRFTDSGGKAWFVDLANMHRFPQTGSACARVVRYGQAELVKHGPTYFTRTRRVFSFTADASHVKLYIRPKGFYTVIQLNGMFSTDNRLDGVPWDVNDGRVLCLLATAPTRLYWLYEELADGSLVVHDADGTYYWAGPGCPPRTVAVHDLLCESLRAVLPRLEAEAEARKRLAEQRRLAALGTMGVTPFRMGRKWGLKDSGGHIVVVPRYHRVFSPVGRYCVIELFRDCRGVIDLEGRVVVEPKFAGVRLTADGTAWLTKVNGEVVRMKLD